MVTVQVMQHLRGLVMSLTLHVIKCIRDCAGNAVFERARDVTGGRSASTDEGCSVSTHSYQQQPPQPQRSMSFSALPVDDIVGDNSIKWPLRLENDNNTAETTYSTVPSSVVGRGGRYSDSGIQRLPPADNNPSITDADKLQQRGHDQLTGGYRGDRIPSRYSFQETVEPSFQNVGCGVGHYSVERSSNFQPYFPTNTSSSAAAAAYSRRLPWTDGPHSQFPLQVVQLFKIFFCFISECWVVLWPGEVLRIV